MDNLPPECIFQRETLIEDPFFRAVSESDHGAQIDESILPRHPRRRNV